MLPALVHIDKRIQRLCNPLIFLGGEGMFQRDIEHTLAAVPVAGVMVELTQVGRGVVAGQAVTQQLGKEMMIAIPLPFFIQRHQEKVGAFHIIKQLLAIAVPQQGIAKRGTQAIEERGLQQKGMHRRWLQIQYLRE